MQPQDRSMTPQETLEQHGPREAMEYDVVVVGAGPAGLATAIHLKQLAAKADREVSVVVLEKGSEPGAHILSGAVMDPRAMNELFPNWKELGAPLEQPVTGDDVLFLSETGSMRTPNWLVPRNLHNDGCYVVALGNVVKWLAQQAEGLGVEIFPGFAAAEVLYDEQGRVKGVATGNLGIGKSGEPNDAFQLGMELHGKYTVFAEGARGHLGKQLIAKYQLDAGKDPQSFAIGVKELWEVPADKAKPGRCLRWWFPLSPGRQQGDARLRGGPRLQQPVSEPVRRNAALEDPPRDPRAHRGRQTHRLRRACHQQRHAAGVAENGVPRRCIDRL
jgi:electron-transferring-flavoprotein dehydrogenase